MRNWNLEESFKPIKIGIIATLILGTSSFFLIDLFVSSILYAFYLWFFLLILIMSGTLFPLARRQDRQMTNTHKGYNQKPVERPFFWFGSEVYNRYRIDEGVLQSMTIGGDLHRDKLDELERKQRDSECNVCGEKVHVQFAPHCDPFYVIENRKVSRILGIPFREKILDWKTYCSEHKPENFK